MAPLTPQDEDSHDSDDELEQLQNISEQLREQVNEQ